MYAVFSAGGKQYRVKAGDTVRVELLDHNIGATTNFAEVLLVGEGAEVKIGQPLVASASVSAEVVAIEKGPKIVVYQKRRRKQYDKKTGHRQAYTRLLITAINNGAGQSATLGADERKKILGNVGFAQKDQWIEEVDSEEAPEAAQFKKSAAPKKVAAKKVATKKSAAPKKVAAKKTPKK